MFDYHFSPSLDGVFVRHYGEFVGAEHWQSVFSILSDRNAPKSLAFIWFDVTAVTSVSMADSDSAYRHIAWKKLFEKMKESSADGLKIVRVADRQSPVYATLQKRADLAGKRVGNVWAIHQPTSMALNLAEFQTSAEALEYLGLKPNALKEEVYEK